MLEVVQGEARNFCNSVRFIILGGKGCLQHRLPRFKWGMLMYLIIIFKRKDELKNIAYVEDIAVVNDFGQLLTFENLDDAVTHRDENSIDGQVIEIPIY